MKQTIIKNIIFKKDLKSAEQLIKDELLVCLWEKTGDKNLTLPEDEETVKFIVNCAELLSLDLLAIVAEEMEAYVNQYHEKNSSDR